jgi:hypothetical protein
VTDDTPTALQDSERYAMVYPNTVLPVISGLRKYRAAVEAFLVGYADAYPENVDSLVEQLRIEVAAAENES